MISGDCLHKLCDHALVLFIFMELGAFSFLWLFKWNFLLLLRKFFDVEDYPQNMVCFVHLQGLDLHHLLPKVPILTCAMDHPSIQKSLSFPPTLCVSSNFFKKWKQTGRIQQLYTRIFIIKFDSFTISIKREVTLVEAPGCLRARGGGYVLFNFNFGGSQWGSKSKNWHTSGRNDWRIVKGISFFLYFISYQN